MPRTARRRLAALVVTPFVALTALVGTAMPAQADATVDLSVSDATVVLGETFTLSWTASDDTTVLEASGDWTGSRALPSGTEDVTPTAAGSYTYTLEATAPDDTYDTDTVTVVVSEGIIPDPVTFPDDCTVLLPEQDGVAYEADYGDGFTEDVEAGTYDLGDFYNDDEPVIFRALASGDVPLADDAVTEWEVTPSDECFDEFAELVEATATCGAVRFTNIADVAVEVLYGGEDEDVEDGSIELGVGDSESIDTDRDELLFIAFAEDDGVQFEYIDVPQDCDDDAADHPTHAPAAGADQATQGAAGTGLPAVGAVAIALLATRAARSTE